MAKRFAAAVAIVAFAPLIVVGVRHLNSAPGDAETDRIARLVTEAVGYPHHTSVQGFLAAVLDTRAAEDGRLTVVKAWQIPADDLSDPLAGLIFRIRPAGPECDAVSTWPSPSRSGFEPGANSTPGSNLSTSPSSSPDSIPSPSSLPSHPSPDPQSCSGSGFGLGWGGRSEPVVACYDVRFNYYSATGFSTRIDCPANTTPVTSVPVSVVPTLEAPWTPENPLSPDN